MSLDLIVNLPCCRFKQKDRKKRKQCTSQDAISYMNLREHGCEHKPALDFSMNTHCKYDVFRMQDGPPTHRIFKINENQDGVVGGCLLNDKPIYDLKNEKINEHLPIIKQTENPQLNMIDFRVYEKIVEEDYAGKSKYKKQMDADLNKMYRFNSLDKEKLFKQLQAMKLENLRKNAQPRVVLRLKESDIKLNQISNTYLKKDGKSLIDKFNVFNQIVDQFAMTKVDIFSERIRDSKNKNSISGGKLMEKYVIDKSIRKIQSQRNLTLFHETSEETKAKQFLDKKYQIPKNLIEMAKKEETKIRQQKSGIFGQSDINSTRNSSISGIGKSQIESFGQEKLSKSHSYSNIFKSPRMSRIEDSLGGQKTNIHIQQDLTLKPISSRNSVNSSTIEQFYSPQNNSSQRSNENQMSEKESNADHRHETIEEKIARIRVLKDNLKKRESQIPFMKTKKHLIYQNILNNSNFKNQMDKESSDQGNINPSSLQVDEKELESLMNEAQILEDKGFNVTEKEKNKIKDRLFKLKLNRLVREKLAFNPNQIQNDPIIENEQDFDDDNEVKFENSHSKHTVKFDDKNISQLQEMRKNYKQKFNRRIQQSTNFEGSHNPNTLLLNQQSSMLLSKFSKSRLFSSNDII